MEAFLTLLRFWLPSGTHLSGSATPDTGVRTELLIEGQEEEEELKSIFYLEKAF